MTALSATYVPFDLEIAKRKNENISVFLNLLMKRMQRMTDDERRHKRRKRLARVVIQKFREINFFTM